VRQVDVAVMDMDMDTGMDMGMGMDTVGTGVTEATMRANPQQPLPDRALASATSTARTSARRTSSLS